jgi:hypothetical protein
MSTTSRRPRPGAGPVASRRKRSSKSTRIPIWVAVIGASATITGATIGGILSSSNSNPVRTTGSVTASSPASASSASTPLVAGDNSEFITDVTYPDGSKVMVEQHFIKKWEIKDTGTARWAGRYLAAIGPSTGSCTYPSRVPVPTTNPGQSAVISVPVTAASTPQLCFVTWKMVTNNGTLYFPDFIGMWFKVNVVNASKDNT